MTNYVIIVSVIRGFYPEVRNQDPIYTVINPLTKNQDDDER